MRYQRAIELCPGDLNVHANYVRHLLWSRVLPEAVREIHLALGLPPERRDALLELYRYANTDERDQALAAMVPLLVEGIRSPGWDLSHNVQLAREQGHPDLDLLEALVAIVAQGASLETLDRFEAWRVARAEHAAHATAAG
jgi:hypothetical protein